ncbi:MAG: C40 family peptidase, partial [Bacteroidales bacterium]|nr:C40 family peptidase [Bacteroidales bacterium]
IIALMLVVTGAALAQTTADAVISEAKRYIGTPYRAAGKTPRGFDCSGFTRYIYSQFGYDLSGSAPGQWHHGRSVSRSELQRGDLVFFGGRRHSKSIGHVGIVTDVNTANGTFDFIHSSSTGVRISASTEGYYKNRYVGARRLLDNAPTGKNKKTSDNVETSGGAVPAGTVDVYSPSKQKQPSKVSKPNPPSATPYLSERQRHPEIERDNAIRDSIKAIMYAPAAEYQTNELTLTPEAEEFVDEE